jgi:hypothetical protein
MMQEYGLNTGWMWVPVVTGVLVLFLVMLVVGKPSKK